MYYCNTSIRFINIYRPEYESALSLVDCLTKLTNVEGQCIVVGDINCRKIDWANLCAPSDGTQNVILDFVITNGLTQLVTEPNGDQNILDVVICNEPLSVLYPTVYHCSDDYQIEFSVYVDGNDDSNVAKRYYDWQNADFACFAQFLMFTNWYDLSTFNVTAE